MATLSSLGRGILRHITHPVLSLSILGMIGLGCIILTPQIYAAPFDMVPSNDEALDNSFFQESTTFNNVIRSQIIQPDGKILTGGDFVT